MTDICEFIGKLEYPGRGILIGRTQDEKDIIAYFVTGRSPPSRARELREEWEEDRVRTHCTDESVLKKGTPALLIYNAIKRVNDVFVVSNGAQTDIIAAEVAKNPKRSPALILAQAFSQPYWIPELKDGRFTGNYIDLTSFEPDAPSYTPRISGILMKDIAALSIVRKDSNVERQYFEFALSPSEGRFISTYSGQNVPEWQPIPTFRYGAPCRVQFYHHEEPLSMRLYRALGPKQPGEGILKPGEDFRVGVSVVEIVRYPTPKMFSQTINVNREGK